MGYTTARVMVVHAPMRRGWANGYVITSARHVCAVIRSEMLVLSNRYFLTATPCEKFSFAPAAAVRQQVIIGGNSGTLRRFLAGSKHRT